MLATSGLITGLALAALAAAAEEDPTPPSVTGRVLLQEYCASSDEPDVGALHLKFRLSFTNRGDRRLILTKLIGDPFALDIARTLEDANAGRFVLRVSDKLWLVDDPKYPPEVMRSRGPDARQFFVLDPGETASADTEDVLSVAKRPERARLGLGKDYVIRLSLGLWPFLEDASAIASRWRELGALAHGSVQTDFIPFSTPAVERFPECEKGVPAWTLPFWKRYQGPTPAPSPKPSPKPKTAAEKRKGECYRDPGTWGDPSTTGQREKTKDALKDARNRIATDSCNDFFGGDGMANLEAAAPNIGFDAWGPSGPTASVSAPDGCGMITINSDGLFMNETATTISFRPTGTLSFPSIEARNSFVLLHELANLDRDDTVFLADGTRRALSYRNFKRLYRACY